MEKKINKGDVLYWARIIPDCDYYEIEELKIRTVEDDYFVGTNNRNKQAYLFSYSKLDKILFVNRKSALAIIKEAEKNKKKVSNETYYEEF